MVNTGVMVVMMAASAGEVNPTPTVKAIWLKMIPKQGGVKQGQPMLPLYGFPWHESGGQPEQEGRSQQAECGERGGTYFSLLHDQFTDGRHEAPDDGRRSHRDMSFQRF